MGAWTPSEWLSLIACAAILALGVVALLRGGRDPLALPLALLCIDMSIWNFATLAEQVSRVPEWGYLDIAFSPLTPPLALHVILAFLGKLRQLRWLLLLAYTLFGASALVAASAFVSELGKEWVRAAQPRNLYFLALWIPLVVLEIVLLVRHWRRASSYEEQWRARLILAAVIVGALLGSTEMWDDFIALPALGHLGALGSMALIATVVLRFRLFGRELSTSVGLYALALGTAGAFGYLAIFQWLGGNRGALVVATVGVTLALFAAARDAAGSIVTRRERLRQLAHLGRFSAQMAHDLKNPVSALKGGIELLLDEREAGKRIEERREILELLRDQTGRLLGVIERYQRLSRVEPILGTVVPGELVASVVAQAKLAAGDRIRLDAQLAELPALRADADLLAGALENLVRNSCEAMPNGGTIHVSAAFAALDRGRGELRLKVEDEGEGMDARQLEQACDDFYTTKSQGSGLGLAFVRRVAEAHGGELRITSAPSRGAAVELVLPLALVTPAGETR